MKDNLEETDNLNERRPIFEKMASKRGKYAIMVKHYIHNAKQNYTKFRNLQHISTFVFNMSQLDSMGACFILISGFLEKP